jgi:hypothetical protein
VCRRLDVGELVLRLPGLEALIVAFRDHGDEGCECLPGFFRSYI